MTTTQRPPIRFESFEDLNRVPGFEQALDAYVELMTECMAEVNASFKKAPRSGGVPPVREVMDKYEDRLRELYEKVYGIYRDHDA